MNNMILEGYESDTIVQSLNNPHLSLLAREITHVYGLKIYSAKETNDYLGRARLYLCKPDGFPIGEIYVKLEPSDSNDSDGEKEIKVRYNYYSPFFSKQRGTNEEDRSTLSSSRLATLMGSMKKNKVMPDFKKYAGDMHSCVINGVRSCIRNAVGYVNPNNYVNKDIIHPLLKAMFGELPVDEAFARLDRTAAKALLDNYNEADRIKTEQAELEERILKGPFYAIGASRKDEDYLVGVCRTEDGKSTLHVDKPFKRIKTLAEVEELNGVLAMLKIRNEKIAADKLSAGSDFKIPVVDYYDRDMEVCYAYQSSSANTYIRQWMIIPCTGI